MFPDTSPITQGKREELTVVKKKKKEKEKYLRYKMCLHQFLWLAKVYGSHSEKTSVFGEQRQQKLLSKSLETKKFCNCSLQCAGSPLLPTAGN